MLTSIHPASGEKAVNEYQVTYSNGEMAVIEAWTPEVAQVIAEEEADQHGCQGLSVVRVELLTSQQVENQ